MVRRAPLLAQLLPAACVVLVGLFAAPAEAQFRNNGVQLPNLGYHSMGTLDLATQYAADDWRWFASDQLTIGTGYFRALGYNLWWDNQVAAGFGFATFTQDAFTPLFSVNVSSGLRYNFLDEEYRPFVSGHIHYLHIFNTQNTLVAKNELLGNQSFWVGARAGGGFEWFFLPTFRGMGVDIPIFYDEMSLQAELSGVMFVSLASFPLLSTVARFSYNVYF